MKELLRELRGRALSAIEKAENGQAERGGAPGDGAAGQ